MTRMAFCMVLALLVSSGCNETSAPQPPSDEQSTPDTLASETAPPPVPVPTDVTYTIEGVDTIPGIKRSLDVRLNKKVPEEVLRSLALKLKAADPNSYERTFIGYYLPGMEVGAGAWATTHFNPNLEVRILGLTMEQERELRSEPREPARSVVGRWLDERPFVGSRITIFRKGNATFLDIVYKDGSGSSDEVIESRSSNGLRFDKRSGSRFGDHWVLDAQGNLQLRDDEGLIAIAKKIE